MQIFLTRTRVALGFLVTLALATPALAELHSLPVSDGVWAIVGVKRPAQPGKPWQQRHLRLDRNRRGRGADRRGRQLQGRRTVARRDPGPDRSAGDAGHQHRRAGPPLDWQRLLAQSTGCVPANGVGVKTLAVRWPPRSVSCGLTIRSKEFPFLKYPTSKEQKHEVAPAKDRRDRASRQLGRK